MNQWSAALANLPHSWEGDIREPSFVFVIGGESFGFFFCDFLQNFEIAVFLGITTLVATLVSCLVYFLVVAPKKQDTTTAYLLGYGCLLPFWICFPIWFIRSFGVHNKIFRFVLVTIPSLDLFRSMEAIHGFCPSYATKTLKDFALYYASPFIARYDKEKGIYIEATTRTILQKAVSYNIGMLFVGALHSLYLHFPDIFIDFGKEFDSKEWYSMGNIFRWQTLWKNLCFAVIFQTYLSTCTTGLQMATIIVTGLELEETWMEPLYKSASFSDFWSRRWNRLIHTTLKRGVFFPVRRHSNKFVALIATFLASGLFHEWIVWVTFSPIIPQLLVDNNCQNASCYQPTYGPAIVFFLFQAFLIALEFWIGSHLKPFTSKIPSPVATLVVVVIGGCMAHWFSDGYVHSSYFIDSRVAYMLVQRLET